MQRLIALTDNNSLISIDPKDLSSVTSTPVTGIDGTLIGIDTRPANGLIYGLTTANQLYTLNPDGFSSGDFSGLFTLTPDESAVLLDDGFYLNLHTAAFAGGELRGQLDVRPENDIVAFGLPLEEAQEVGTMVPPPDGPGMGSFDVVYDDASNTLRISGTFSDLTAELLPVGDTDVEGNLQSSIHLHRGAAGENGPILRNFTVKDDGSFSGAFTLTDAEEALLLDQALYINLHTDNFGGGELRGQVAVVVEGDVVELGIPIEEVQQVGGMVPDGPATGSFDAVYDVATGQLGVKGSFAGLSAPLLPVGAVDGEGNLQSAIHLHQGMTGENGPIVRNLSATDDVATFVSTLSIPFGGGVVSGFDFNPVPDRLRLVGDNNQNFRINVDTGEVIEDGTLAFVAGDGNFGVNPSITASAYLNSFAGATSTALYNIDALLNKLVLQNPPNDGGLVTVGELGFDFGIVGGFDIASTPEGENVGFALSDGTLFTIDLQTGAATSLGSLDLSVTGNVLGLAAIEAAAPPLAPDFLTLTSNNTLLGFNAAAPDQVTSVAVTGVVGTLLGIDVRPADGQLYGLTTANNIYTIDPSSGEATLVSTLSVPFGGGVVSGFDFNPVPDRLRLVGDNDQNFRINVDTGEVIIDGTLAFVDGDANAGVNPNITASAYTNAFDGATSTALYNIDALLNKLVLQNPPNDGGLVTIGELGVNFGVVGGFDIVSTPEGDNAAFAASDGVLYSIDLTTGAATSLGTIGDGTNRDLLGFVALSNPLAYRPGNVDRDEMPGDYLTNPAGLDLGALDLGAIAANIPAAQGLLTGLGGVLDSLDLSTLDLGSFASLGVALSEGSGFNGLLPQLDVSSAIGGIPPELITELTAELTV
jgi:hypothetical protein